jgi:membrane protein DedA with SNARE-associated domain
MHLFTDYIQPVSTWLQTHPYLALLVAFLVSFTESLAIIGSVIPGSVTMTALGILAGSGVMRIDLTLLSAILGATAGDGFSYLLGYTYSDKLNTIWPFRRYPQWLTYGKDYFSRHGGKSILIGRFIGPLRSIIPVIAGMMHMQRWRFFSANVISAIGWSLLYILPGVLIGRASNELSTEIATRLFALVLVSIGALWLLGMITKWLIMRINCGLQKQLYNFYLWSINYPLLARVIKTFAGGEEEKYLSTFLLCLSIISSYLFFFIITYLVASNSWIDHLNVPIYFFLQSLRVYFLDVFFISITQLISYVTLGFIIIVCFLILLHVKDWRSMGYWLSLNLSNMTVLFIMHWLINSPRPTNLLGSHILNSYPAIHLTLATTYIVTLVCYLTTYYPSRFNKSLTLSLTLLLGLEGLASTYLGDNWIIDSLGAYFCGISLSLTHWLYYQRHYNAYAYLYRIYCLLGWALNASCHFFHLNQLKKLIINGFNNRFLNHVYLKNQTIEKPILSVTSVMISIVGLVLFSVICLSFFINYNTSMRIHTIYPIEYVFTEKFWWLQDNPILPVYRTNRIGRQINIFNVQYAGNLNHLEKSLVDNGWHNHHHSFFSALIRRVNGVGIIPSLPLIAPLYLNQRATLTMTYIPTNKDMTLVLQIWRSNYHLKHLRQPIWLGTLSSYPVSKLSPLTGNRVLSQQQIAVSLSYLNKALSKFKQRQLSLITPPNNLPYTNAYPRLLLIKESMVDKLEH